LEKVAPPLSRGRALEGAGAVWCGERCLGKKKLCNGVLLDDQI
jgi:hypothetical protein